MLSLKFGNSFLINVDSNNWPLLAEFNRKWQSNVTKTNNCEFEVFQNCVQSTVTDLARYLDL